MVKDFSSEILHLAQSFWLKDSVGEGGEGKKHECDVMRAREEREKSISDVVKTTSEKNKTTSDLNHIFPMTDFWNLDKDYPLLKQPRNEVFFLCCEAVLCCTLKAKITAINEIKLIDGGCTSY